MSTTLQEFIDAINDQSLLYAEDPTIKHFADWVVGLAAASWPDSAAPVVVEPAPIQPTPSEPAPAPGALQPCIDAAGYDAFFNAARSGSPLGPKLAQNEVDGCNVILTECSRVRWPVSWSAYALATAYHETAGTMQPIREYGRGAGKPYGNPGADGQVPYGRGYVQLTWDYNYSNADKALKLNGALIKNYDLALQPDIAVKILSWGMEFGKFTGKGMGLYLPKVADIHQFSNCRRVVNALDKAVLIAGYAISFQTYLLPIWRC